MHQLGALTQEAFANLYSIDEARLINPKIKQRRVADYEAGISCELMWVKLINYCYIKRSVHAEILLESFRNVNL